MTDVFISYSRQDGDFVRRLFDIIQAKGRDAWVDWQSIDYSTKWWEAICEGIDQANNFVFVISPHSLDSKYCHDELVYARSKGKRTIPLYFQTIDEAQWLRQPLSEQARENWKFLNTIQFINWDPDQSLDRVANALIATADINPEYAQSHTDLLLAHKAWKKAGKNQGFLLRGARLVDAEQWLINSAYKSPAPTDEQKDLIATSRTFEDAEKSRLRNLQVVSILAAITALAAFVGAFFFAQSASEASSRESAANTQIAVLATDRQIALEAAATATIAQGVSIYAESTASARVATATVAQGAARNAESTAISQVATSTWVQGQAQESAAIAMTAEASAQEQSSNFDQIVETVLLISDGRSIEALDIIDAILARRPNESRALIARALVLESLGQFDEAIEVFSEAIAIDPTSASAYLNRAKLFRSTGDLNNALDDYNRAAELDESTACFICRGGLYEQIGDLQAAARDYQQARVLDDQDFRSYVALANLAVQRGDFSAAIRMLDEGIATVRLDSGLVILYISRSNLLTDPRNPNPDWDKAVSDLETARLVQPENPTVLIGLVALHTSERTVTPDFQAALENLDRVIELYPRNYNYYTARADALTHVRNETPDFARAIEDVTTAISLNPRNADLYLARANLYIDQRNPDQNTTLADSDFTTAIEFNDRYAIAYYLRGSFWASQGNFPDAINDLSRIVEVDPNGYQGYTDAAFESLFSIFQGSNQLQQGIEQFTRLITLTPERPAGYMLRGALYYLSRDFENAKADWDTVTLTLGVPVQIRFQGLYDELNRRFPPATTTLSP